MLSCSGCVCTYCLHQNKGSGCPYGICYDDYRAAADPYTQHMPERHLWSRSHDTGEQEHWCRGGIFYPAEDCQHFIQYDGRTIEQCHKANIEIFQDGTKTCCMMVDGTCERCLKEMDRRINEIPLEKK